MQLRLGSSCLRRENVFFSSLLLFLPVTGWRLVTNLTFLLLLIPWAWYCWLLLASEPPFPPV